MSGTSVPSDSVPKKPRKRTTRACDQCNQFRTKCDGVFPCAHCVSVTISCTYFRAPLKRGKASESYKKTLLQKGQGSVQNKPKTHTRNGTNPNSSSQEQSLHSVGGPHITSIPEITYRGPPIHNGRDATPELISVIDGDSSSMTTTANPGLPSYLIYSKYPTITADTSVESTSTRANLNNTNEPQQKSQSYASNLKRRSPKETTPSLVQILESPEQSEIIWRYPSISSIVEYLDDILTQDLVESCFEEYLHGPASEKSPTFEMIRKEKLLVTDMTDSPEFDVLKRGKTLSLALVWKSCMESPTLDTVLRNTLSAMFENILLTEFVLPKTLDDVIALIEVGSIYASANCRPVAVRLWKQAIMLGLQIQLNVRVPGSRSNAETTEERRRTWWFLYVMDMHLAFLYGTLPIIPEKETEKLQMPCSDEKWHSDEHFEALDARGGITTSRSGVVLVPVELHYLQCFIPLANILSSMVTARAMSSHPKLRVDRAALGNWTNIIRKDLESIEWGLGHIDFNTPRPNRDFLNYIAFAYYVLVPFTEQPWDPLSLFSLSKLSHEVEQVVYESSMSASAALSAALEADQNLDGIPVFFSVYLYFHSFSLLMIDPHRGTNDANKLEEALQTAVRAHDVCISKFKVDLQTQLRDALQGWLLLGEESVLLRKKLLHSFEISRNSHDILF